MQIPNEVAGFLARINLSSYEWRVLISIHFLLTGEGKHHHACIVSLDEMAYLTEISKEHVSRAIRRLMDRGILNRTAYRRKYCYSVQQDLEEWRI